MMGRNLAAHLESDPVACHGRESAVPQKAQDVFRGLDAGVGRHRGSGESGLVRHGHVVVPFPSHPAPDEEDVSFLKGDVAFLCDFENGREFDLVPVKGAVLDALLFGVGDVVDQDAAACHAGLGPVLDPDSVALPVLDLGCGGPAVEDAVGRGLVAFGGDGLRTVTEAIPLRAYFCICEVNSCPKF